MSKKKHELSALQAAHCINVGVFLVVIAIMGLAAVFLPKPTVSEYEKRELEKFPSFSIESLFSGEYMEKLDLFFADTFPAREKFVELAAGVEEARGVRIDDVKIHEAVTPTPSVQPEPPKEEIVLEKPTETTQQPEKPSEETPVVAPGEEEKEEAKEEETPLLQRPTRWRVNSAVLFSSTRIWHYQCSVVINMLVTAMRQPWRSIRMLSVTVSRFIIWLSHPLLSFISRKSTRIRVSLPTKKKILTISMRR